MNMQPKPDDFKTSFDLELRPYADFKQDKAIRDSRIILNDLRMATRKAAADNPDLVHWFLFQVHMNRETSVENIFAKQDIEGLVLREPEETVVRRGRTWTLPGKVWLPGFIIVRCVHSMHAFRGILGVKDVCGIVGGWARPYKVADDSINAFNEVMQEREDERERLRLEQEAKNVSIKAGDRVRIRLGPFSGMEAKVVDVAKGGKKRCKLQYKLFGRPGECSIPLANLEKL